MQKKPQGINRTSPCFKFKTWCAVHRIPTLLFPLLFVAIVAIAALVIGGIIAGWNVLNALTSPTGVLIEIVLLVLILGALYYYFTHRDRW